ncbi:MAG: hypothetical protein ACKVJD_10915 [Burkholderiales bacterium]
MAKDLTINMAQVSHALNELHESWRSQTWAGLPTVVGNCLSTLGYTHAWAQQQRGVVSRFMNALHTLAEDVECIGLDMQERGVEPAYHHRKHMAQVVTSMTALLLARRNNNTLNNQQMCQELSLVVCALGHDVLHDGQRNKSRREAEIRSASYVTSMMKVAGLGTYWRTRVATIIELTDPVDSVTNHAVHAVRANNRDLKDLMVCCVLTNEADILASTLPDLGAGLTEELAAEWDQYYPKESQGLRSNDGRIFFLKRLALFSSTASHRLGLPAIRHQQLVALGAA